MAVSIVGTGSASTTGALTIVIPIHASTAIGDDVYLQINFRRTGGTYPTVTTPSGYFLISTGTGFRLYQRVYTTTPPADVTITFGSSDTHCMGRSVTVRGFLDNASSSWRQISTITGTPITQTPKLLSERITEFDGTVLLSFYATHSSLASCAHRASIAASTTNPTTTFAITIGSGTTFGDSLFCQVTSRDHTSGDAYPTVTDDDTGGNTWTRIAESADRVATLWWKRATGATASKTITVAGCIGSAAGGLSVYQNAATLVTPYTNIVVESNASADEAHAGFTPDHRGSAICLAVFNYGAANAVSSESTANLGAMTERWEKTSTGGSGSGCVHASINGTDTAPAATGAITWAQTNGVTHSIAWAVRPESVIAASVTVPAEQTELFAATQAGPPDLGIAAGSQLVADAGTLVPEQSVTLSGTTILTVVQASIVPADAVSIYDPHWETPLGPYAVGFSEGKIVFDTTGNYAYHVNMDASSDITIRKIARSTFTVDTTVTLTGEDLNIYYAVTQDSSHLYIALENTPFSYKKIQKSDLAVVDTGDAATNVTDGPHTLAIGKAGTWSEGMLFGSCYASAQPPDDSYKLVAWNVATGSVISNTSIPMTPIGGFPKYGAEYFTIDNNGDVWFQVTLTAADFPYTCALIRVSSGPTVNSPILLPTVYPNDDVDNGSMTYDAENHAIVMTTSSILFERGEWSQVARYNITGASLTYVVNYGGLYTSGQNALDIAGNGLRDFNGKPSIFQGWFDSIYGGWPATIVQFNHETGVLIRSFEMQGGYDYPSNIVLSPEGDLWMGSGFGAYIHKLRLTGDENGGILAQGYISWAEMQVPDPTTGAAMVGPYILTYGTRWGLSMGLSRDSLPDFLRDPKVEK